MIQMKPGMAKKRSVIGALAAILVLAGILTGGVSAGTETLISTGSYDSQQLAPSVWGDYIVWENQSGSMANILLLDMATGKLRTISNPSSNARAPRVQGTSVVWHQYNPAGSDIYLYNITENRTTRLTAYAGQKLYPVVYGKRVVWQEYEATNSSTGKNYFDIVMYDPDIPGQVINITPHAGSIPGIDDASHTNPSIWGNVVVWQDSDDARDTLEIFMNDTATGTLTQVSDDPGTRSGKYRPAISGTGIVWVDYRNRGNADIFYDTVPPTGNRDLTPYNDSVQLLPAIFGDLVIWVDDRGHPGSYQIGMSNLTLPVETYPVSPVSRTPGSLYIAAPSLHGNRMVWSDTRVPGKNAEIYLYTDGVSVTCPVAAFTQNLTIGNLPLTVQFNDTSQPVPVTWIWDFGDGKTSIAKNPQHTYTTAGTYPVTLTAGNSFCRNATSISNVHNISAGAVPVVGFSASPREGVAPLTVSFLENSSGAPSAWNWSFGDGGFSNERNPTHTYTRGGTFPVTCNATNIFGTGSLKRAKYITVLTSGAHEVALTNIPGITVLASGTRQILVYNTTLLPQFTLTPGGSAISSYPPLPYGWQNITFHTGNQFVPDGDRITGNLSFTDLTTKDILPSGISPATGTGIRTNYRIILNGYQKPGSLTIDVWDGTIPSDEDNLQILYTRSQFTSMHAAYTVNTTLNGLFFTRARINMSVGSAWESAIDGIDWGRNHSYIMATGRDTDGSVKGIVLPARYLFNNTTAHLEYFEADIPRHLQFMNKFTLVTLSGSGNPFQLITLTVTQYVEQPQSVNYPAVTGNEEPAGGKGTAVTAAASTQAPVPAKDPGKSAKVYTNANGTVTQATLLRSTDGLATISLSEGTVARDARGHPLSEITLKALPLESLPAVPQGSSLSYAGMAYDLGPDGSVFAPYCSFSLTPPGVRWGQDYTIRSFDGTTGTWQDLPTAFNTTTGTITAQVSHLCTFALFSRPAPSAVPAVTAVTTVAGTPSPPAAPPAGAIGIFADMLEWIIAMISGNPVISIGIVILIIAAFLYRQGKFPGSG